MAIDDLRKKIQNAGINIDNFNLNEPELIQAGYLLYLRYLFCCSHAPFHTHTVICSNDSNTPEGG